MKTSQPDASPTAKGQSRQTPKTMADLRKLNPRTALVILGGALARRKVLDRGKLSVVLLLSWAATLLFSAQADAQRCYTVRDSQGTVVYQSLRPPVDTAVSYKDEIEAMFPGSHMEIGLVFNSCGMFTRQTPVEAAAAQPSTANPERNTSKSVVPVFDNNYVYKTYGKPQAEQRESLLKDMPAVSGEQTKMRPNNPPVAPTAPVATPTPSPLINSPQAPPESQSSFGNVVKAGIGGAFLYGIFMLYAAYPRVAVSMVGLLVALLVGTVLYSLVPSELPVAKCVLDKIPNVQTDVTARAQAELCVSEHGGYNTAQAKGFLRGHARSWMTYQSRAECVAAKAANTRSEFGAGLIVNACDCLYRSNLESQATDQPFATCG